MQGMSRLVWLGRCSRSSVLLRSVVARSVAPPSSVVGSGRVPSLRGCSTTVSSSSGSGRSPIDDFASRHHETHTAMGRFVSQVGRTRENERTSHATASSSSGAALPAKHPSDSLIEVSLPFGSNDALRQSFVSASGYIRVGSLLEEMDLLAGRVAYKHSDGFSTSRPLAIVTAACDRISLASNARELDSTTNMRLVGRTTWVGRSSMEVVVELDRQAGTDHWERVMRGFFVMVSRDAATYQAAAVNPLLVETEEEQEMFRIAQTNNEARKRKARESAYTTVPSAPEMQLLHSLFVRHEKATREEQQTRYVYPSNTVHEAARFMHPQYRNIHGKVFGGYLMRQALELAYISGCLYSECARLRFLSMDDITFFYPVNIGSILTFSAQVTFANIEQNRLQVMVSADVINPQDGKMCTTNVFHFTFQPVEPTKPLKSIMPLKYKETMEYVESLRRDSELAATFDL